jgi:M6 family metalloprotease-like protein
MIHQVSREGLATPGIASRRASIRSATIVALGVALWIAGAMLASGTAQAVPAAPIVFELTQPNGVTFEARAYGDEWNNGIETVNGFTILQNRDTGFWEFAERGQGRKLQPSGLRVAIDSSAGLRKHLRPEATTPTPAPPALSSPNTGTQRSLVILVQFNDQLSQTAASSWSASFFGASNSVQDYYDEVSYSQLTIAPASESHGTANDGVVGWLALNQNHPNTAGNLGSANEILTRDAILAADPFVDFASFDTNGNGYLSANELHITVVAAGYEAAYGEVPPGGKSVWGHRGALTSSLQPTVDGVVVGNFSQGGGYTQFGEMDGDHQATIGIMVHEMGHDLNLPDLYDADGSSEGVGEWSIMGSGNWLAQAGAYLGSSPSHPDPFSRTYEGWLTAQRVQGSQAAFSIPQVETNQSAIQLLDNPGGVDWTHYQTSGTGEYFLVENRQRVGYDAALPGCGLLIWHIDETRTSSNSANADEARKLVDLEEADGLAQLDARTNRGDAGDPYPGSSNNRTFDDSSNPNSWLYSGVASGVSVTNISSPCASTMTADLSAPGSSSPTITSFSPTSGPVGTSVIITGTNLAGATSVTFGGVAATTFTVDSATQITATVPTGAVTGRITATTPNGTATSAADFTVGSAPPTSGLQFSASAYWAYETAGSANPTVTRVGDTSAAVSVDYATSDGTATAGADYTAASGTLSFGPGETSKSFAVPITADSVTEGDETVNLTLSNPTGGASLGTPSTAVLTILGSATEHARTVSFYPAGRRARGQVSVTDGFSACAAAVPVKLQYRSWKWRTVATGVTSETGGFSARLSSGSYRVVAKQITLASGDVCLKAISPKLRW